MIIDFTAAANHNGRTIYSVMRHELHFSASMIRRIKNTQSILLCGKNVYTTHILSEGEHIVFDIEAAEPPCDNVPESGDISILYETDGLLALNKPAGQLVHPSHSKNFGTLANFAAGYLKEKGELPVCHAVNRLDRDTSGVVLFAKNSYMKERAVSALSSPAAEKHYLAIVLGMPQPADGTIDLPIKRLNEADLIRVVAADGKPAVTHYKTVKTGIINGNIVSLLSIKLETGRTHQIRVHFSHIGTPLLGDMLYSTRESRELSEFLGISTQALHAEKLIFPKDDGTSVNITTPITRPELLRVIDML